MAERWPELPTLAESAGSSSNSVYEMQNEVQLMSAIPLPYQHHGGKKDWPKLAEDLCLGCPLQSYARSVGKYIQMYGGLKWLFVFITLLEPKCYQLTHWASCCLSSLKGSCLSNPNTFMLVKPERLQGCETSLNFAGMLGCA